MTEEEKPQDPQSTDEHPELPKPICPECGADPLMPAFRQINIGQIRAVVWFCSACRKAVPVFLLPVAPPQRPMIVPPSGRIMQ